MSASSNDLPATTESAIDENGIKTITSWKWGPNHELVKVTRKVKMVAKETPVLKRVLERSRIVPFGLPAGGNEGVTIQSVDEIHMEKAVMVEEKSGEAAPRKAGGLVCKYCKGAHLSMRCPHKELYMMEQSAAQKATTSQESASAAPSSAGGRYVPPARRAAQRGAEYKEEDEGVTIRISSLAETVDERVLRDLFSACGYCRRVRIPIDYETHKSRGFGFITYGSKDEAQRAIAMYNGYALDHFILSVSIAENRKSTAPRYATGYGKALPQNTKR